MEAKKQWHQFPKESLFPPTLKNALDAQSANMHVPLKKKSYTTH